MVKITTRQQFELLVQNMEANPNIARGVRAFGETKATTEEVWRGIAENLNSCGPPIRTSDEWQRVWIHFKAKLKKKLSQNKRNLSVTGGGPSQEVTLSPLEQAAADILQMKLVVNPEGNLFGSLEVLDIDTLETEPTVSVEQQKEFKAPKIDAPQTPRKRIRPEEKRVNLLQEQTETQAELLNTLKKIEKNLYKKNEILKEMKDMKRKKYEVLKDIRNIKKMKYENLVEEQILNRKIKEKKLEVLKKQLQNLENSNF